MTKFMSTSAYGFDPAVKKAVSASRQNTHLNLPLVGAVLFCAAAWSGVAYLVVGLLNH